MFFAQESPELKAWQHGSELNNKPKRKWFRGTAQHYGSDGKHRARPRQLLDRRDRRASGWIACPAQGLTPRPRVVLDTHFDLSRARVSLRPYISRVCSLHGEFKKIEGTTLFLIFLGCGLYYDRCRTLIVGHTGVLGKNRWTNRGTVYGAELCGSKEPHIR